ncbi:MAG: enoyl-CoA hydratase/isomerase family protein [Burkholderiaceae bacterium]|nr:enoyl-CoA hydratase/isomerase family protein [Burkholderiaceae bacterium]
MNGLALASGLELVLCCDLVIAARSLKIGDAQTSACCPAGSSVRYCRAKIGPTRADTCCTPEFVPAEQLVAAGLVNEVVDDAELIPAAQRLVAKLVPKSSLGVPDEGAGR